MGLTGVAGRVTKTGITDLLGVVRLKIGETERIGPEEGINPAMDGNQRRLMAGIPVDGGPAPYRLPAHTRAPGTPPAICAFLPGRMMLGGELAAGERHEQ